MENTGAALRAARRDVTCPVLGYHAPCTATDRHPCQITNRLTEWNSVLFPARFELQELPAARGHLSLVSFSDSNLKLPDPLEFESSLGEQAIYQLLATHHCITSLRITATESPTSEMLLCEALRRNNTLKTLKLDFPETPTNINLATAIQRLKNLEEVECNMYAECPGTYIAALCTLIRISSSLISFRMWGLILEEQESQMMLAALTNSSTLREFSTDGRLARQRHEEEITNYLRFPNTLTSLCMAASNSETQLSLLRGVLQNRTLESLSISRFMFDEESTGLVARIFRENEVLLAFSITSPKEMLIPRHNIDYNWIAALASNNTLEELTLPMSVWPSATWENFFRVLSTKAQLKKVHIEIDLASFSLLPSLWGALTKSGVEGRVSWGNYLVIDNIDLIKCRAFSDIYFFCGVSKSLRLEALRQLPQCGHLTSVAIDMPRGDLTLSAALADYLKSALHLRKLQVSVVWTSDIEGNLPSEWWTVITKSFSIGTSLRELAVSADSLRNEDLVGLADSVSRSQSISTFDLRDESDENSNAFVTRLSTALASNYTLRRVRVYGRLYAEATQSWFMVSETTRRNSSILARAAHFCNDRQLNRQVAGALERVSKHTALIEDLAEICRVTKDSTAASVRACLKSFEPMDAFMRLAGVVRERVVCYPRQDGLLQLDQLNMDCWILVRRYLMLEDIKTNAI